MQGCNDVVRQVAEGSPEAFQIGLPIPGDDLDNFKRDIQALTFSIDVLDGPDVVTIHGCTGQLEVSMPLSLDFEAKQSYKIKVSIKDDGIPTFLAADTVLVLMVVDSNEAPVLSDTTRSVNEVELDPDSGVRIGGGNVDDTVGVPLAGSDPDNADPIMPNKQKLAYSIVGGIGAAYFKIDATTGQVTLATPLPGKSTSAQLNFESVNLYKLDIKVEDDGILAVGNATLDPSGLAPPCDLSNCPTGYNLTGCAGEHAPGTCAILSTHVSPATKLSATAELTVNIVNINEAPIAPDQTMPSKIKESSAKNTVVGTYSAAYDPDDLRTPGTDTLIYTKVGSCTPDDHFTIDPTTGVISSSDLLDFETAPQYKMTVSVTDQDGLKSRDAVVTIDLEDVNEAPTVSDATLYFDENSAVNTNGRMLQDPVWQNAPIENMAWGGASSGTYATEATARTACDAMEGCKGISLKFADAGTGGGTTGTYYTYNLASYSAGLKPFTNWRSWTRREPMAFVLNVTDPDDTVFTYSVLSQLPPPTFFALRSNGIVDLTLAGLDAETNPEFTVIVKATDGSGLDDEGKLTIKILDLNDQPYFTAAGSSYAFSLDENSPKNTPVGTQVLCVNDDDGDKQAYTFMIVAETPAGLFQFDVASTATPSCLAAAQMKVASTVSTPMIDLNFEGATNRFDVSVSVTDTGTPKLSAVASVVITLNDINDAPVLLAAIGLTVSESAIVGSLVDTIVATDDDISQPTEALTYTIDDNSGNMCGGVDIFKIESKANRGELTVADWKSDGKPCGTSSTPVPCEDKIKLCTVPQHVPICDSDATTPAPDCGSGDELGAGDSFVFTLRVTDQYLAAFASATSSVTVTLTESNDSPVFTGGCATGTTTRTVKEDALLGSLIEGGLVLATDDDGPTPLLYSIITGNVADQFAALSTGGIKVNKGNTLDYENAALRVFHLELKVSDKLGASRSCTVTVNVLDINEKPEISATSRAVDENKPAGSLVGLPIPATDPEILSGVGTVGGIAAGPLAYTRTGSITVFEIHKDGATAGQIKTLAILDKETMSSYTMTVIVTDPAGLFSEAIVTVVVQDKNDLPKLADKTIFIPEDTDPESSVPAGSSLDGSDEDVTDNTDSAPLRYTMLALSETSEALVEFGKVTDKFEVFPNQNTVGRPRLSSLILKKGKLLDFETKSFYSFKMEVSDDEGASATAVYKIHVSNVNELSSWGGNNCGSSSTDDFCFQVKENTASNTMFRDFPASVVDKDGVWGHVATAGCEDVLTSETFGESSTEPCWKGFTDDEINAMMVNSEMKLVFETATPDPVTFYIQLVDYPSGDRRDFASKPSNNGARWRLSQDVGWQGPCSHSGQLDHGHWFFMKSKSRDAYVCESGNYENTIVADGFQNRDQISDFWPLDTTKFSEGAKLYVRLGWGSTEYSVASSSPKSGVFTVARESWPPVDDASQAMPRLGLSASGLSGLDYEALDASKSYVLTLRSTDGGGLTQDTTLRIQILDENEPPVFPVDRILTVDENMGSGIVLTGTVVAMDPDDVAQPFGSLRYSIVSGSGADLFKVGAPIAGTSTVNDKSPNVLTLGASLDFEKTSSYTLQVRAFDNMVGGCGTVGLTAGHPILDAHADGTDSGTGKLSCDGSISGSCSGIKFPATAAKKCVYWEVEYGTDGVAGNYLPHVGVSSEKDPAATGGGGLTTVKARFESNALGPRAGGRYKPFGEPAADFLTFGSAITADLKITSPADSSVCAKWKEVFTITSDGTMPEASDGVRRSLNNVYKISTGDATKSLYVYDPSPRWSGTVQWNSDTVRSDTTSQVRCTVSSDSTTPSWSADLPSKSSNLASSCLARDGSLGDYDCGKGDGWLLLKPRGAGASTMSGHPCPYTGDVSKLSICVAVVHPFVPPPRHVVGVVLDYDNFNETTELGGPVLQMYSDNVLWTEELIVGTGDREFFPFISSFIEEDASSGATAKTWRSARLNLMTSQMMFEPRVSGAAPGSLSAQATYTVNIVNVNEKPRLDDVTLIVAENSPSDTKVGAALEAIDDDLKVCDAFGCTPNACKTNCQRLTYTRMDQTPCFRGTKGDPSDPCLMSLDIDPCTGQVLVSNPLDGVFLNYEGTSSYILDIKVVDDGTYPGSQEDSAKVTVVLIDVNEAPVVSATTLVVNENSKTGLSLGFVAAIDQDNIAETHGTISLAITAGNLLGMFRAEKKNYHDVDSEYSKCLVGAGGQCWCKLRCPSGYVRYGDGSACSHPTNGNCDLGYCQGSPNHNMPTCAVTSGGSTGSGGADILLDDVDGGGGLNFESVTNTYQVTITATDGGCTDASLCVVSGALSGSGFVDITVRDVNEPPELADVSGGLFFVAEDQGSGTHVGVKLVATDEDIGQSLTYAVISSVPASGMSVFTIETNTGQIKVAKDNALDFETTSKYTLKVRATDNGSPKLSTDSAGTPVAGKGDASIEIDILDVNESPVLSDLAVSVPENSLRDTIVASATQFAVKSCPVPTDPGCLFEPDAGQSHQFTIESGNSANFFSIATASGVVTVNRAGLDFEDTSSYSLLIKTTDSGDPKLSDTATLMITVLNRNDAPTMPPTTPTGSALSLVIPENSAAPLDAWRFDMVTSTERPSETSFCSADEDSADTITFSILSGNAAGNFDVVKDTTDAPPRCFFVRFINPVPSSLDFEDPAKNVYTLTIEARDDGINGPAPLVVSQTVTVTVLDRNDLPRLDNFLLSVPENAKANNPVGGSVVALDQDVSDILTYSIDSGPGSGNVCGANSPVFSMTSLHSVGSVRIDPSFNPAAIDAARKEGELQSCISPMVANFSLTVRVSDGNGGYRCSRHGHRGDREERPTRV